MHIKQIRTTIAIKRNSIIMVTNTTFQNVKKYLKFSYNFDIKIFYFVIQTNDFRVGSVCMAI